MQNSVASCYQVEFTSFNFKFSKQQNSIESNDLSIFDNNTSGYRPIENVNEMKLKLMDLANLVDYMRLIMMKLSVLNKIKEIFENLRT